MADSPEYSSEQKPTAKNSVASSNTSSSKTSSSGARGRKRPSTRRLKHHIRNFNHVRLALLVAMLFTLLVATMFRTTPIVFMAALLFAAQFMASMAARVLGRGLDISRVIPEIGYAGDTVQGQISVRNNAHIPAFLVHVEPGDMTTGKTGIQTSARTQNTSRTTAGLSTRVPVALAGPNELLLPILRPSESVEWQPRWKLGRRGVWDVPPAQIGARDPLGLFTAATLHTEPDTIVILPRPVPLERVDFRGGESQTHTPQHSSIAADAFDFHGIRAWQAGEAIRRVHWKSTARTGELHVVEWEEDFGSDLCVLLDMRATRRFAKNETTADDALETMITLAASVTAHLINSGHAVRLFCWQENENSEVELSKHEARSGRDLVEALKWMAHLESLAPPRPGKNAPPKNSSAAFLNNAQHPASLSQLAQAAAPHLQGAQNNGDAILVLCCAEADYANATSVLSKIGPQAKVPTVIAIDSASFILQNSEPSRGHIRPKREKAKHISSSSRQNYGESSHHEDNFSSARVRVLRHGQSLAAVLEQ